MEGWLLRLYVHENQRVHGRPAWEWLLEEANRLGLRGGSAFRAMAGFGRHHQLHEDHFFELAGTLTVEVQFVVSEEESTRLLGRLAAEQLRAFYALLPARFGIVGESSPAGRESTGI